MTRIFVFLFIFNFHHCQSLSTVNPKTYFKPDLKRKESRLTGCQILVLRESKPNKTLNNPFLRKSHGFGNNTKLVKDIKITLNGGNVERSQTIPVKLKRLQPGNQSLIIESSDFKLPLNFSLKWEQEMLVLVLLPRSEKYPVRAIIKSKKVLAGVEFRQMLEDLRNWHTNASQIARLNIDPAKIVSSEYIDEIGKKGDFVDFLTIWKKRLTRVDIKSFTMRPIKQKLRINVQFVGHEDKSSWTKCLDLLLDKNKQVLAFENKECNQNFFASWTR